MNQESEIKKLSCYAVLRTGLSGENYLISHMRLVLLLIYKKRYQIIEPKILMNDFFDEYHYKIDYFPMLKILSIATEKGYLVKEHNRKKYVSTESIAEFKNVEDDIRQSEKNHQRLMQSFITFCQKRHVSYTLDKAEEIVISYINTQKLEHISGHIPNTIDDKRIDYLFGQFVYDLKANNTMLFDYLNSMVIGAVLADCLVFHEILENGKQLDGLTVILDTTPVFIALGFDIANRKEYYENLLSSLKNKGVRLTMFEHSYNEMQFILSGSKEWVESFNYDPTKASAATEYFRSIGANKEDVEEISNSLRQSIQELGIEIIDPSYDPENHPYQISEDILTKMIIEQYQKTSKSFDLDLQIRSIDLDVKSIAMSYFLRKKQKPMHIQDANYLFITANKTLAKVATDYHNTYEDSNNSLPPTITDVFLGTYLWLGDPVKISQMNEQQIMTQAYLAFQPSDELLEKLVNSVNKLEEKGDISSELCYMLRSSRLVSEKLAQKTLGNPDAFTDSTTMEILKEIQDEAAEKARNEMTKEMEKQKEEHIREKANIESTHISHEAYLAETIHMLSSNLLELKEDKLKTMQAKKEKGAKARKHWQIFIVSICILFILLSLLSIVSYFILKEKDWYSPLVTLLLTLLPAIGYLLSIIYSLCHKNTSLNLRKSIDIFLNKRESSKLSKLEYSFDEEKKLEIEINDMKAMKTKDFSCNASLKN